MAQGARNDLAPRAESLGQQVADKDRAARAWQLRFQQGMAYAKIAKLVGYSSADSCRKMIGKYLAGRGGQPLEHVRAASSDRLDEVYAMAHGLMVDTKLKPVDRVAAGSLVIKVEERRARLLGLDKPKQIDVRTLTINLGLSMGLTREEAEAAAVDAERLNAIMESQEGVPQLQARAIDHEDEDEEGDEDAD